MKPEQYNVEDLFRSAFEDASLEPPHKEDMWEAVQSAVQNSPTPVVPIFRTNRFKVSIAASVVLLLGVLYYFGKTESAVNGEQAGEIVTETKENTQNSGKQKNALGNKDEIGVADNSKQSKANKEVENSVLNTKPIQSATSEITTDANTTLKEKINAVLVPTIDTSEKKEEKIAAAIGKEEAFTLVRYEIREIIALASPEIIVPFSLEKQPILQLVAVIQPKTEGEKAKSENTFWIGFGGFYNTYQPNFQFNTADLPSPFVKGKLNSINFADSSNVARDIRENMTVSSAISLNIDFGKVIGRHWFVRSGFNFSSTTYTVNSPVIELLSDPNSANPVLLGRSKAYANTINSATSVINIPVQFGYQSDRIGFNYFASGGITTDILLNNSLTNTYAPAIYDFGNYKSINLSVTGSVGLLYNFTSQFGALVEFNYRRSVASVYDSPHFSSKPQWTGVGVGIRKKF
jgi:hypothetical protein